MNLAKQAYNTYDQSQGQGQGQQQGQYDDDDQSYGQQGGGSSNKVEAGSNKRTMMTTDNNPTAEEIKEDMIKIPEEDNTLTMRIIKVPDILRVFELIWLGGGQQQSGGRGDYSGATSYATQHSGDSGDHGMFSHAIQHAQDNPHQGGINDQQLLDAHQQVYSQGGSGGLTSGSIGTAAALQAFKSMMGGGNPTFPLLGVD